MTLPFIEGLAPGPCVLELTHVRHESETKHGLSPLLPFSALLPASLPVAVRRVPPYTGACPRGAEAICGTFVRNPTVTLRIRARCYVKAPSALSSNPLAVCQITAMPCALSSASRSP